MVERDAAALAIHYDGAGVGGVGKQGRGAVGAVRVVEVEGEAILLGESVIDAGDGATGGVHLGREGKVVVAEERAGVAVGGGVELQGALRRRVQADGRDDVAGEGRAAVLEIFRGDRLGAIKVGVRRGGGRVIDGQRDAGGVNGLAPVALALGQPGNGAERGAAHLLAHAFKGEGEKGGACAVVEFRHNDGSGEVDAVLVAA